MRSLARKLPALVLLVGAASACGDRGGAGPVDPSSGAGAGAPASRERSPEPFVDATASSGIDFVHFNGMSGEYYFAENMGSGGALFDYDDDGDLDLYAVQGGMLGPGKTIADALLPPPADLPPGDRLYRNELSETGRLHFTDVTDEAGIVATGYGMGVATGDIDADGRVDLYVTNFGPNVLLRNNGDGTFSDVTATGDTGDPSWGTSAAFVDIDGDGDLDLFVANYVAFTLARNKTCFSPLSARDYCDPATYDPTPDRLYRNLGDGRFEDVTAVSRIARHYGAGLGVICTDLDGDGRVDIYVANDGHPNQMWINRGDGTFTDEALLGGSALNADGKSEASMGVDAADFDGDGDEDLFMTHMDEQTNTLYVNDGAGRFTDATLAAGLATPSLRYTGFGAGFVDYDNDGWPDLVAVNGAVRTLPALARAGDPYPLHQRNQLFHNLGNGRFEEVSQEAGAAFELSEVSRGSAFGDVDNDGDVDLVVFNNNGPARLLRNEIGATRHWLGVRMIDSRGLTDVLGTHVALELEDGSVLWRRVRTAASYCSANDPRVVFGLGRHAAVRSLRAHWPDGRVEEWYDVAADRYTTLRRGSGREVSR